MKRDFYDKKIIILDLNFQEVEQYRVDEIIYAKKLLKELTANQNIIVATDNPIFQALRGLDNLSLKVGYLISNGGTTVTNIANQKTISTATIDPEVALKICNLCVWNNIHFSIVTDDAIYPFNLNYWMIKRYKSDLSYLYQHKCDVLLLTPDIKEILGKVPVRKIEVYFLQRELYQRKKEMFRIVAPFESEIDYSINVSTLQILPKGHNKLSAIQNLIQTLEINSELTKDGIYVALDQFDHETSRHCYFTIIGHELIGELSKEDIYEKEVLPLGSTAWVKWFHVHEHLWNGSSSGQINRTLDKYKDYKIVSSSLIALQNGGTKWLYLEKTPQSKITTGRIQLSFWPQQVPQVVSVLKKYS